jgi:hypothetical protein
VPTLLCVEETPHLNVALAERSDEMTDDAADDVSNVKANLCNNSLVLAILEAASVDLDSLTGGVAEMESLLQQPLVYSLITAAGRGWCHRSVDETAENAVAECWQHHGARSLTFDKGPGSVKTRITGYGLATCA